ncbi:MAG: methyltransferase domain-containing protein [Anaerolineae bacterium]|nr:methyltransferase domain-containing protein [Anaerolineae bacterium]
MLGDSPRRLLYRKECLLIASKEQLMHSHKEVPDHSGGTGFLVRHLFLLIVALAILSVLYVEAQNLTGFGWGVVLLLLAHVVAIIVIMHSGRALLRRLFQAIHGPSDHSHYHAQELETEGRIISWAWFYDIFTRLIFASRVQTMMKAAVSLAKIQPGEKVLDVGCGTGTLAVLAKQGDGRTAELHGIDAAPEMIERARQKAKTAHVEVDFQPGLAEDIRFEDDAFDLVMNSFMMHHLTPELREKALAEIYRVLKPGGRLLIVDFEPPKPGLYKSFLTLIIGDMTSIDNTTLLPIVRSAGFQQVEIGTVSTLATYISGVKLLA